MKSPTPWSVQMHNDGSGHSILDAEGEAVASWYNYGTDDDREGELAVSRRIVEAMNTFEGWK